MKCPVCGSLNFFVKDPDDAYETYDFELMKNWGRPFYLYIYIMSVI